MGVSKNNGTPKSSILIGFSIINHPFWGTPIFGNTQIYRREIPAIPRFWLAQTWWRAPRKWRGLFPPWKTLMNLFAKQIKTIENIPQFSKNKKQFSTFQQMVFGHFFPCQFFSWTTIPMEKITILKKKKHQLTHLPMGFVGTHPDFHSLGAACAR